MGLEGLGGEEAEAEGCVGGEGEEEVQKILKDLKLWNEGVIDDLQKGGGEEEEEEGGFGMGVGLLRNNE